MLLKIILVLASAGLMFGQCGKTVPNPKTGAPDCVGTATGTGDALTTNPLNQFAATTSAQLAGVLSNETGTGLAVFGTGPTITLPNATALPDGGLTLTDVTTNNSSTSNHGFLKKLDNSAAHFMDGQGNWSTPAGGTAGAPLFVQTASSSAVTAASETTLIGAGAGSLTIPAAWFTSAGTVMDACASGLITTGAVPGTVRFKLKFGSTIVADTGAVTPLVSVTNGIYETCLRLTARTVGASGTVMVANILPMTGATLTPGEIVFANPTPGTAVVVDTTATQVVDFTVTWGTGAINSITGLTFVVVGPGSAVSSVFGQTGAVANLSGDCTTAGSSVITCQKVNGISHSATQAAHTVEVVTSANTAATAKALPDCPDTGGNHINFATGTDAFSCGTSSSAGTVTDSGYTRYWTASSVPNLGAGVYIGPGWISDGTVTNAGYTGSVMGLGIVPATGAHYLIIGIPVPTGWNGAVSVRSFFQLQNNASGTGTGTHHYSLSCFVPGTTVYNPSAFIYSTVSDAAFNVATGNIGAADVPTFAGGQIPSCSAGQTLYLRVIRDAGGTAADPSIFFYADISLPHTVQ